MESLKHHASSSIDRLAAAALPDRIQRVARIRLRSSNGSGVVEPAHPPPVLQRFRRRRARPVVPPPLRIPPPLPMLAVSSKIRMAILALPSSADSERKQRCQ
jgi:hypothetical protein